MARDSWTDARVDGLNLKVDRGLEHSATELRALRLEKRTESTTLRGEVKAGFERVDGEFKAVRAEVKAEFDKIDARFERVDERFETINGSLEALNRTITAAVVTLSGGMFAGFAGLIATRLWS